MFPALAILYLAHHCAGGHDGQALLLRRKRGASTRTRPRSHKEKKAWRAAARTKCGQGAARRDAACCSAVATTTAANNKRTKRTAIAIGLAAKLAVLGTFPDLNNAKSVIAVTVGGIYGDAADGCLLFDCRLLGHWYHALP